MYYSCLRYLLVSLFLLTVTSTLLTQVDAYTISEHEAYREMYPRITADGSLLYFTRGRHPRNKGAANSGDIWFKQLQSNGNWGRALNAGGPINSFADDRVLAVSADARYLAVLRKGQGNTSLDILKKGARSWTIVRSESLNEVLPNEGSVTFDLSTNTLFYAKQVGGHYDLFQRTLQSSGWEDEKPMSLLNSNENETQPCLSPDASYLYFRRNNTWQIGIWLTDRQAFGLDRPVREIPSDYLELAFTVEPKGRFIATVNIADLQEELVSAPLPENAMPVASKILQSKVPFSFSGNSSLGITIKGQQKIVYPNPDGVYTLVVPADVEEKDLPISTHGGNTMKIASIDDTKASRYALDDAYNQRLESIPELNRQIVITTNEVAILKEKRQELAKKIRKERLQAGQEVLEGYIDPELSKLRSQMEEAQISLGDTIQPDTASTLPKPTIRNENNAAAIDELNALRSQFIAAQRARTGEDYDWKSGTPAVVKKGVDYQTNNSLDPTLSNKVVQQVYAGSQIDSLAMEQSIRSNLFSTTRRAVYEPEEWENELIKEINPQKKTLDRSLGYSIEKDIAQDNQLQQSIFEHQEKLKHYQDQLDIALEAQRKEKLDSEWSKRTNAKPNDSTIEASNKVMTYTRKGATLSKMPSGQGQVTILSSLRFGPNSAIIKLGTTQELDLVANQLAANMGMSLEVGVHGSGYGNGKDAKRLSIQRANSIKTYLQAQGIHSSRIVATGYGNDNPIADGSTVEGRMKNQRIEVRIQQ